MRRIALVLLLAVFLLVNGIHLANAEESAHPRVAVFSIPPVLLADGVSYETLVVQLLDATGKPMKAPENVTVFLSSSSTAVGTVQTSVHVEKGSSYTVAGFTATKTPGNTTITAIATGYESSSTSVTTTISGEPQKLVIYTFAPIVIANNDTYGAVVIQLQNNNGSPARAPHDLPIYLSSSIPSIGKVASNATIHASQTYTVVPFRSAFAPGSTSITAITSGYKTGTAKLEVQDAGLQDFALTVESPVGTFKPGEPVIVSVKTESIHNLNGQLELIAGDVPKNSTAKFEQNPIPVSGGTTLEITVPKPGVYSMSITAKVEKIAHTKTFKVKIGSEGKEITDFASFYGAFTSAILSFDLSHAVNLLVGYPLYFAPVGGILPVVGFILYKKKLLPMAIFGKLLRKGSKEEE